MSDDPEVTPSGEETVPAVSEPSSPAALSVTGRARRIGGRPVLPGQSPASPPPESDAKTPAAKTPAAKTPVTRDASPAALRKAEAPAPRTEAERGPAAGSPSRIGLAQLTSLVLGVAALVLVVLIAIASHGVYWGKSGVSASARNTTQEAALAAAKTCVATINTYDYRHLGQDEVAATSCATGKFASDLATVYKTTLTQKAPVAKAVQTAQVNRAGIRDVSSDGKQIDVLIYGQLTLTNVSTTSGPQYDPFGAVLTMDKVGSKWLVAKVSADVGTTVGS